MNPAFYFMTVLGLTLWAVYGIGLWLIDKDIL